MQLAYLAGTLCVWGESTEMGLETEAKITQMYRLFGGVWLLVSFYFGQLDIDGLSPLPPIQNERKI